MGRKALIKKVAVAIAGGAVLTGSMLYVWQESKRPAILEIYFIDASGNTSIFIRTPEDVRVLIDGGPNSEVIRYISKIIPFYSRRIDNLVSTSETAKANSGLIDVLERYGVSHIYVRAGSTTDETYKTFLEEIKTKDIPLTVFSGGDVIRLDRDVSIRVGYTGKTGTILYIEYKDKTFMLLGRTSVKVQNDMAKSGKLPRVDLLQVSQNATPTTIGSKLVAAIGPTRLIYSKQIRANDKKIKPNILSGFISDQIFNLRETGIVKVSSDGSYIRVEETI